jgi:tetratricopeptide (TPR) repeat protein
MELLNLQSHDPEEYEGKLVICNGCEYVIGTHLGAGAERTVHKLVNRRSQLCLHAIKFWHDQEAAGSFVQWHQKQISLMRRDPKLREVIPVSLYFQGHGGFFELQRFVGPQEEAPNPVINYILEGDRLRASGEYAKAIPLYQYAVGAKPFHTLALHNLAVCHAGLNNYQEALGIEERVVQIEPNDILYRNGHITFAANSGAVRLSLHLFEHVKSLFPYVPDLDDLGITIYLACGEPQRAERLLAQGALSDGEIKELQEPVKRALAAKATAVSMMKQAKGLILSEQFDDLNARRLLEEAYRLYDKDPFLALNLGLSLQRAGDVQSSIDFLLSAVNTLPQTYIKYCYANAAYGLIKAARYDAAMTTLEATMSILLMLHGGEEPRDLAELPGVTIWVDEESAIEERIQTAATLIAEAITRCQRKESVTEPVRRLAALYRTAAGN